MDEVQKKSKRNDKKKTQQKSNRRYYMYENWSNVTDKWGKIIDLRWLLESMLNLTRKSNKKIFL